MNINHNLNLVVLVGGVVMAIIAIATLLSCTNNNKGVDDDTPVYEFEFEGHTYLEFEGCGIVHDPECKKCKNR